MSASRHGASALRWPARILLLVAVAVAGAQLPAQAGERKSLIVTGAVDESGDQEWNNLLIAHGISRLVSEYFFQSGLYEELETEIEVREQLEHYREINWRQSGLAQVAEQSENLRQDLKSDAVAFAVVKTFKRSRSRVSFAFFSRATIKIEVSVAVHLKERGQEMRSAIGTGRGETKAQGMMFQIREDKIAFDQTSVGLAVAEAVRNAVVKLVGA